MTKRAIHYLTHPFQLLKAAWSFLELTKWRVLFLFIAWVAVCYYIYSHGGVGSVERAIRIGFESALGSVVTFFATIVQVVVFIFVMKLWLRSGPHDSDLLTNPAYSDHESNIFHDPDEH